MNLYLGGCSLGSYALDVAIIITIKNHMKFIFFFLFIFITWRLYYLVVFIAKLFMLFKFTYLSFIKISFVCKKSNSFQFISGKEGLDTTVLSSFLGKLMFTLFFIYFISRYMSLISLYISFLSVSSLFSTLTIHPLCFRSLW